jgi:hypothetical protein
MIGLHDNRYQSMTLQHRRYKLLCKVTKKIAINWADSATNGGMLCKYIVQC